jgi:hypothetical protein
MAERHSETEDQMRKITTVASILFFISLASPACAQSAIDGDVRCFLLSNAFAKQATDEKARGLAATSLAFYLGRLDAKANVATIADAIRRDRQTIDPKTAGTQMSTCAAHMGRLEQSIETAVKSGAPAK